MKREQFKLNLKELTSRIDNDIEHVSNNLRSTSHNDAAYTKRSKLSMAFPSKEEMEMQSLLSSEKNKIIKDSLNYLSLLESVQVVFDSIFKNSDLKAVKSYKTLFHSNKIICYLCTNKAALSGLRSIYERNFSLNEVIYLIRTKEDISFEVACTFLYLIYKTNSSEKLSQMQIACTSGLMYATSRSRQDGFQFLQKSSSQLSIIPKQHYRCASTQVQFEDQLSIERIGKRIQDTGKSDEVKFTKQPNKSPHCSFPSSSMSTARSRFIKSNHNSPGRNTPEPNVLKHFLMQVEKSDEINFKYKFQFIEQKPSSDKRYDSRQASVANFKDLTSGIITERNSNEQIEHQGSNSMIKIDFMKKHSLIYFKTFLNHESNSIDYGSICSHDIENDTQKKCCNYISSLGFAVGSIKIDDNLTKLELHQAGLINTLTVQLDSIKGYLVPDETKLMILAKKLEKRVKSKYFREIRSNITYTDFRDNYLDERQPSVTHFLLQNGISSINLINIMFNSILQKNPKSQQIKKCKELYFKADQYQLIVNLETGVSIVLVFICYDDFKKWINGLELLKEIKMK